MTERTGQILEAVIQEFIKTGEPVSSGLLYDRYEFGIKPAMIRLELDELEERGFLEQPHHSAGRIPTNSGYEFFAKRILGSDVTERPVHSPKKNELRQLLEEQAWPDLMAELSNQLGLLSVAADRARDAVYKSGLERLIDSLDWQDQNGIRSVIHDFEEVDQRMSAIGENMEAGPNVFIGKKSPVTKSEHLSVVGGNYPVGDSMVTIFVIGPKRMDYKKVIQIFRNL
jgi:heat-inducible transcriptional repressor